MISDALKKYFPEVEKLRDVQQPTLDSISAKKNTLCLMSTGSGKSLIYQLAGLANGKTTIVFSPLVALMGQQVQTLTEKGIKAISLSEFSGKDAYNKLRAMKFSQEPQFLFLTPERVAFDGYIEFVLRQNKDNIGLVVLDEAHCVSQWGYTFRPAYAGVPHFLDRVFGATSWPTILALTATLNPKDQDEITSLFRISKSDVVVSKDLLRTNLDLKVEKLVNETAKLDRLEGLLAENKGQKIIVYVHRKTSKKYGTKALSEDFSAKGYSCMPFDGDMDSAERMEVVNAFKNGDVNIVFATSAFGMGIDIKDVRIVIHYLMPESIEQYYQEVGRAGRDGKQAYGYLLYTEKNAGIRKDLINASIPDESDLDATFENRQPSGNNPIARINPWGDFSEDNLDAVIWSYFERTGVIDIIARGTDRITYFKPAKGKASAEYQKYEGVTRTGLILGVSKKLNCSITSIMNDLYSSYHKGELSLEKTPEKDLFYSIDKVFDADIKKTILDMVQERNDYRLKSLEQLVSFIESGKQPHVAIKEALGL